MKLFKLLHITILLLLSSYFALGQFNIQTGYDFGVLKFPKKPTLQQSEFFREINYNIVHRINVIGEYQFNSNLIMSLNFGYDTYRTRANYFTTTNTSEICTMRGNKYDAAVNTFRLDFSFGYLLNISRNSKLVFKGSYGFFKIQNQKIFNSERTLTHIDCSDQSVIYRENYMLDFVSLDNIYGTSNLSLNQLSVSAEYRYRFDKYQLNIFLGFSPMNKEFTVNNGSSQKNLLFLLGLRLGYTFPQKKIKENEK